MTKIKITEEDLDYYKSNKEFLNQAFKYSIRARDIKALELLFESTTLKSCLNIKPKELFGELLELVIDDKNLDIVKLIFNQLKPDLKQQKIQGANETLLDIAAYYKAENIVTFLLQKGFDPNNKDKNGQTSLHKAVIANSSSIIDLLINKGANINIQDTIDGNTPLHLATLLQSKDIIRQLKWHNAQCHIKSKKGYNQQVLHGLVARGLAKITIKEPQLPEPDENLQFYKGVTNFYKAVLSEGDKERYFASAIDETKSFIDRLAEPSASARPSVERECILKGLELLVRLYKHYKYENSAELQEYIIDRATPLELFTVLTVLYNIMCVECLEISDYNNAIIYAEHAYALLQSSKKTLSKEVYELSSYDILFNLGLAWKHLDIAKSLPYFAKAEGVKPNDQEAIIEQLKHYINLVDINNVLNQIEKIKDSTLKDLYQIMLNIVQSKPGFSILISLKQHAEKIENLELKELSNIMLKFASEPNSSLSQLLGTFFQNKILKDQQSYLELYKEIWLKFFLQNKQFDKAIECCNEINICSKERNIPTQLFKILEICKEAKWWEKGLKFIEDKYEKYPEILPHHAFPLLKLLEFIFYKQEGREEQAESCLEFLKTNASTGDISAMLLSHAEEFAFYVDIEKENFVAASSYLQDNPTLLTTDKLTILLAVLQEWLQQPIVQPTEIEATEAKTVQEENTDAVIIDWIDDKDELSKFIAEHPKAIHVYCQQRKQDLLKQRLDITAKEQQLQKQQIIWCTETGASYTYNPDKESSAQQYIHPIENKPNFYVMIDQKLHKLNKQLFEKFKKALSKGFVPKNYGNCGIKIMDNKLAELKISGDDRLYADHIYKNSQGKYLINFDKHGNHEKVIKILKGLSTDSLEIIETDETSYSPTLPKEPECSATSECTPPELDLDSIMNSAEDGVKALGVSGSDNTDVEVLAS